jgi:hypothetical protein
MYIYVSKCKNNKIRGNNKRSTLMGQRSNVRPETETTAEQGKLFKIYASE